MFENRVSRGIFGSKRDEVSGEWRKLHKELNDLYSSPNNIRVIKSKIMSWAWHVACMGERRGVYRVLEVKPEGERKLEDPGVDWRRKLKWFCRYLNVKAWTESSWHRIGIRGGSCESGNELPGSIKCGEFLDNLKTAWLLKDCSLA